MIGTTTATRPEPLAPGPTGHRLLGNLRDVRKDRFRFVLRMQREYGDAVCFRMGRKQQLFLFSHPSQFRRVLHENPEAYRKGLGLSHARPLLGAGLLTSEGNLWARQRNLLQQAFDRKNFPSYGESMVSAAEAMVRRSTSGTVELARECGLLALEVLQHTVLRVPLLASADQLMSDLETMGHWTMRQMAALIELPLAVPTPGNLRARRALGRLWAWARRQISERRSSPANPGSKPLDALDVLLAASPAPSEEQIEQELLTLLVTGYETSASVLAWTLLSIAQHSSTQEQIQQELQEQLGGRAPTAGDLPRLPFCRQVIDESLRLYPPVWLMPRQALADDVVGGYRVPAGSHVLLSIASLHRNPSFWQDPELFRPQRFSADGDELRQSVEAFLPFGSGPRACLGRFFGKMEILLAVATLCQRWTLAEANGPTPPPEPLLSLRPGPGLRIEAHAR